MNNWLEALTLWHWLALGVLLLGADRWLARGRLLGTALAAFLVAVVLMVAPAFSWAVQVFLFGTFSVVFTLLYRRRPHDPSAGAASTEETEALELVGRVFLLDHSLSLGHGTLKTDGRSWPVHCAEPVAMGGRVKEIGVEGHTLKVIPLQE